MKPLSEPSQGRQNSYLGWTDNQLLRRPPIPSAAGTDVPWATGRGNVTSTTAGNDTTLVFPDIDSMATNRPDIFNLGVSNEPLAWGSSWSNTCVGLDILVPSFYRIWAQMAYTTVYNSSTVGANFHAAAYNNFVNAFTFLDFTECVGFNRVSLGGTSPSNTDAIFNCWYMADFVYYDTQPIVDSSTVIPFGLVQNTTHGGQYIIGFMIYQLASGPFDPGGDFPDITYLP